MPLPGAAVRLGPAAGDKGPQRRHQDRDSRLLPRSPLRPVRRCHLNGGSTPWECPSRPPPAPPLGRGLPETAGRAHPTPAGLPHHRTPPAAAGRGAASPANSDPAQPWYGIGIRGRNPPKRPGRAPGQTAVRRPAAIAGTGRSPCDRWQNRPCQIETRRQCGADAWFRSPLGTGCRYNQAQAVVAVRYRECTR